MVAIRLQLERYLQFVPRRYCVNSLLFVALAAMLLFLVLFFVMFFRCKFRQRRSIPRPRFPARVQNFGDLVTFSVDFCILYAECPPYFYFRFVWPTSLESIPHASTPTSIIPTKFEVDVTTHCRVISFLSVDTSRVLVTLTFWPWTVVMHGGSRDQPWPPSLMTLRLFIHEFRVITVPTDYHWKCVPGHCACAESRDPWVWDQNQLHFWNPRPRFANSLYNFCWATTTISPLQANL